MQRYLCKDLHNIFGQLGAEESHHLSKVLRAQVGHRLLLTDGMGKLALAELTKVDKAGCDFRVCDQLIPFDATPPQISLAIAPTHHPDRMEWLLEKAVEIGVGQIALLQTARTERNRLRPDRAQRIMLAAMKQSQRSWLPTISEPLAYQKFIEQNQTDHLLLAHCMDGLKTSVGAVRSLGKHTWLLIGPEGDFTPDELNLALNHGATAVSLGQARLRTETAAIFGLSVWHGNNSNL